MKFQNDHANDGNEEENNTQMMLYALGAYLHYGIVYDIETVEMVIFQPRIDNTFCASITIANLMA